MSAPLTNDQIAAPQDIAARNKAEIAQAQLVAEAARLRGEDV